MFVTMHEKYNKCVETNGTNGIGPIRMFALIRFRMFLVTRACLYSEQYLVCLVRTVKGTLPATPVRGGRNRGS